MKRVQRMKMSSPTMLGASHQVVRGSGAMAEPVLFLSSSVGLQRRAGGHTGGQPHRQRDRHPLQGVSLPHPAPSHPQAVSALPGTLARAAQVT